MKNTTTTTSTTKVPSQVFTFFPNLQESKTLFETYQEDPNSDPFGDSDFDFTLCQASFWKLTSWIIEGQSEGHRNMVIAARKCKAAGESHSKQYKAIKSKVPVFLINLDAGTSRKKEELCNQVLGNYHYFDMDNFSSIEEMQKAKAELAKNPFVAAVWTSIGGLGLGGLLRIDWLKDYLKMEGDGSILNAKYKSIMMYVWREMLKFEGSLDDAIFNLTRITVLSYDTELHRKLEPTSLFEPDYIALSNYVANDTKKAVKAQKAPKESILHHSVGTRTVSQLDAKIMQNIMIKMKASEVLCPSTGRTKGARFTESINGSGFYAAREFARTATGWNLNLGTVQEFLRQNTNLTEQRIEGLKSLNFDYNYKLEQYLYRTFETIALPSLEEGEYLSKYFEYSNFGTSTKNFKVVIDAPTGVGKNIAVIQNAKKDRTILVVPLQKLIKSVLADVEKYCPDLKVGCLYEGVDTVEKDCDLYVTSYNSFVGSENAKTSKSLLNKLDDFDYHVYKDFLLVIDEIHTINYDRFKQLSKTDSNFFINIINNAKRFERFIGLTGTLNSTLPLEVDRIIEVRRKTLDIKKEYGYIIKNSFGDASDFKIIQNYIGKGYFPLIYKQNTKKDGWRGKMEEYALNNGFNLAFLNAKEKESSANEEIINKQLISEEWSGLVVTSAVREGVSTFFEKPKKVVCLMLDTVDADTAQQISHRIRNASEVLIVNVVTKLDLIEWDYERVTSFNTNAALLKIDSMVAEQLSIFNDPKFIGRRSRLTGSLMVGEIQGVKHKLIKLSAATVEYRGFPVRLYEPDLIAISQLLTAKKNHFEKNNLLFTGWVGQVRYGWDFKGRLDFEEKDLTCIKAAMALRKRVEKQSYNEAIEFLFADNNGKTVYEEVEGTTMVFERHNIKYGEFRTNFNRLASSKKDLLEFIASVQKESYCKKTNYILDVLYTSILSLRTDKVNDNSLDSLKSLLGFVKESNNNKGKVQNTLNTWNLYTQYKRDVFNNDMTFAEDFNKIFKRIEEVDRDNNRASNYEDLSAVYKFKELSLSSVGTDVAFNILQSLYERGECKKAKTDGGKRTNSYTLVEPQYIKDLRAAGFDFDEEYREPLVEKIYKKFNFNSEK